MTDESRREGLTDGVALAESDWAVASLRTHVERCRVRRDSVSQATRLNGLLNGLFNGFLNAWLDGWGSENRWSRNCGSMDEAMIWEMLPC